LGLLTVAGISSNVCSTFKKFEAIASLLWPFQILQEVGKVAYRLNLLASSLVHPIFHMLQLKKKLGKVSILIPTLPPVDKNGVLRSEPEEILERRTHKKNCRAVVELLVRWHGQATAEASWETFHRLKTDFPHLVSKVF
jgi:hypothetical protein